MSAAIRSQDNRKPFRPNEMGTACWEHGMAQLETTHTTHGTDQTSPAPSPFPLAPSRSEPIHELIWLLAARSRTVQERAGKVRHIGALPWERFVHLGIGFDDSRHRPEMRFEIGCVVKDSMVQ